MGLYFRRSVRVGPLRFNFSRSGIGVSTGIPGFRIGTGPRGAYVHMGVGGVYYRQSLRASNAAVRDNALGGVRRSEPVHLPPAEIGSASVGPMEPIDSTSVVELTDSSSRALLDEIQRRQGLQRIGPLMLGGVAILVLALWSTDVRGIPLVVALCCGALAYWWASAQDAVRRTVVVSYDLDAEVAARFDRLMGAIKTMGEVGGLWHVDAEGQVMDRKYHAGAASVINRNETRPGVSQPPILRTNLDVPFLNVGKQKLYFLPDRLLVVDGSQVGAINYDSLQIEVGKTRFIEAGSVPNDAQIVDRTWRYVNKKGGPDRRFSDNREMPVVLYETIHFRSPSGLNELLHASGIGVGAPMAEAVAQMGLLSASDGRPVVVDGTGNMADPKPSAPPAQDPRVSELHNDKPLEESSTRLRRRGTVKVIEERGRAWEYRTFALALIDVMEEPPGVPVPFMPSNMDTKSHAARWASDQLKVPQLICARLEQLINTNLKTAVGPPGKAGDPQAILDVAWEIGCEAAKARAWATAVWTTLVPQEFVPFREELARTMDQPLRALAGFGPQILTSIETALNAPEGKPAPTIDMRLAFTLPNQEALLRAIESALRP